MKTLMKLLAVAASALATAAASAAPYGRGLATPGFEDVIVLDNAARLLATGGDDGIAARQFAVAWSSAQDSNPFGARPVSMTERVFAAYLPGPAQGSKIGLDATTMQSMVVKRKQDLLSSGRLLMPVPLGLVLDNSQRTPDGRVPALRDQVGNYVFRFKYPGLDWLNTQTGQKSFISCFEDDAGLDWRSEMGGRFFKNCIGIPAWTGMDIPWGMLVNDVARIKGYDEMYKAASGLASTALNKAPIRAGFLLKPVSDVQALAEHDLQGREFAAESLVLWDADTFEVIVGPIDLKGHSPQLLYSTMHCKDEMAGIASIQRTTACDALNPTMVSRARLEF